MRTPEGRLKDQVKALLCARGVASLSKPCTPAFGYYTMPVPNGYGEPMLDFVGCYKGRFFAIETKAEGKEPTARQNLIIKTIREGGGCVMWSDDFRMIETVVESWFNAIDVRQAGF